jgi:hypothetical protein
MINAESKTEARFQVLLAKITELVQSDNSHARTDLLFRPNSEKIPQSLSFFEGLQSIDLTKCYDEDRVVIKTMEIRGLVMVSRSLSFNHAHGQA